jgi:hypothetical protein
MGCAWNLQEYPQTIRKVFESGGVYTGSRSLKHKKFDGLGKEKTVIPDSSSLYSKELPALAGW